MEGESRSQQRPCHVRESEEQQGASSKGVNCPDGGPGEQEVDETETEGSDQGALLACTGLTKHGRGVEGDNVDTWERSEEKTFQKKHMAVRTTHLLSDHHREAGKSCTSDPGNGKELGESTEVIASADDARFDL